jgi:DNA repair exonuclease SbcCD nuclease subunit
MQNAKKRGIMNKMVIPVTFSKLENIIHMADIHVRLFRRHDEYQSAFDTLYKDIQSKNLKDFIIVVVGDIVHAKTDMSPEMVDITSRFLETLADIAPTILVAGNHDCNLANTNRLDTLTPIVNNLKHKQLYYARDSTIVYVADTAFVVNSVFDKPEFWPTATDVDSSVSTKVALYHGPVHGAITDAKFTITSRHVSVDKFTGYDIVLLGDIHRAQTLQEYSIENIEVDENEVSKYLAEGWELDS